jgi:anaerobic selenocysteine-containing dehydrogenase
MTTTQTHEIRTTCPRDCYDACGALVRVEVGPPARIVHVRGDPDHPVSRGKLCRKCTLAYNGVFLDPGHRLTEPLVRTGPKGSGSFKAISWEEAAALVAARLGAIREQDPTRIVYSHYTGSFALLSYFYPMRLMRALGATEVAPDTICNDAGHTALGYVYGTSLEGFDPRTASHSDCILVWGANPSASAPHQHEHWLTEAPGAVVVVDPVRTPTAAQADLHLQPFPGSDAALAFGLMHVLARDGLVDFEFMREHTVGAEELLSAAADCDPSWTSSQTGVPAADIERAAQLYGAGPSLLWIGQGLQRQLRGGNVVRAVAALPAVTGNLGRAGSGFVYLNGGGNRGIDDDYLSGADAYPDAPPAVSHMELADLMASERAGAFVCWNVNPLASCPEQARLRRGLEREELFTVVCDLFATDTADYADVVLPAASWLECDDIVVPYFHRALAAQVKSAEPLGQSLPNSEIFRRIALAMGLSEPSLTEPDDVILERVIETAPTPVGSFGELARLGTVWTPAEGPAIQFADLRFPTPSGRVELASESARDDGQGLLPVPVVDARPRGGRLRLLSPASPWSLNASFSNDAKVARQAGELTLSMTAFDADLLGLSDGALARISSEVGELVAPVRITDDLPAGVALMPKGGWPKLHPGGANVNVLTQAIASDMGASTSIHGLEVTVAPAGNFAA